MIAKTFQITELEAVWEEGKELILKYKKIARLEGETAVLKWSG